MIDINLNVQGKMEEPTDLVCFPETEHDILELLKYCSEENISCVPFGGGSSVVLGINPPSDSLGFRAVITLDMIKMNEILEIDEVSLCARVQGGVYGPTLEEHLKSHGNLTFRYFPQSFEFSTVGGWLATRGGGHFATLYQHVDDLVESLRIVTPVGVSETRRLPGSGAGPSETRMYLGSEGTLGVISEAWIRIRKRPTIRASATVIFNGKDSREAFLLGAEAVRSISQSGIYPANCRLVDGQEMVLMTKMQNYENTSVLLLGFESDQRENLDVDMNHVLGLCRKFGGKAENSRKDGKWTKSSKGGERSGVAGAWGKGFMAGGYISSEAVLRGVLSNTFETAITWDKFPAFYKAINAAADEVMSGQNNNGLARFTCRFTHVYPDGPAPYFTAVTGGDISESCDRRIEQWMQIKNAVMDVMIQFGATSTHHHAVGRLHRRHYDKENGALFKPSLSALKSVHDPKWILNPEVLLDHPKSKL
mmetsp:Transcript_1624/g.2442  ORF Transcript_1624/g.2442 Transcript_1624/m.2442 type:complete len:479 (+) Transcript_1624:3-1439(+)